MNKKNINKRIFNSLTFVVFNRQRSLIVCALFIIALFTWEVCAKIPNLFAASGAIMTLCGLFLNIKYSLNFHLEKTKLEIFNKLYPEALSGSNDSFPVECRERIVDDVIADEIWGTTFMVIGTLIWAFGGFIEPLYQ